jgi:hypothetical protein
MTRHPFLLGLLLPLGLSGAAALHACSDGGGATTAAVGGAGGGPGGSGGGSGGDASPPPPDTGPTIRCTLDNGTDPVGLCAQKLVLGTQHKVAFDPKRGVAQSWDATTSVLDTGPGDAVLHDLHDDASYAASIARYHKSSGRYGDDEITGLLDADLVALVPILQAELAPLPAEYAGELYADLRTAAGGLRVAEHNDLADPIDALADAYGRAVFDTFYVALAAGDGGAPDGVIGAAAGGGATAYAPADVATGALALLDLAVRHTAAEPAKAATWQQAAVSALDHLWLRARDPATGMYFRALVTSADPGHDALPAAAPGDPPGDALLADVQARVALALVRAQDLADHNPAELAAVAAYPFEIHAEAAIAAVNAAAAGLWNTSAAGYAEGFVPSTSARLGDEPTRANALLLASIHRASLMGNTPFSTQFKPLRALFTDRTPAHTSLLSVVPDQTGYFRAAPPGFDFTADDAGAAPRRKSYFSASIAAAVEGLTELWYGLPQ